MPFLGIDAGASATKWALVDGETELQSGYLPAMDAHIYREASLERFHENFNSLKDLLKDYEVKGILMGITGLSKENRLGEVIKNYFDCPLRIISDIELAYRAHFAPAEGLLLYAGTGSVGFYIHEDGRGQRFGGWGYLLGDEGAGYWIGREAIRFAMFECDAAAIPKPGSMTEAIMNALNAKDWDGVKQFVYGRSRDEVAALSHLVANSASKGDLTAIQLLENAAGHLAELVQRADEIVGKNLNVTFTGGISRISFLSSKLNQILGERLTISKVSIPRRAAELAQTWK